MKKTQNPNSSKHICSTQEDSVKGQKTQDTVEKNQACERRVSASKYTRGIKIKQEVT